MKLKEAFLGEGPVEDQQFRATAQIARRQFLKGLANNSIPMKASANKSGKKLFVAFAVQKMHSMCGLENIAFVLRNRPIDKKYAENELKSGGKKIADKGMIIVNTGAGEYYPAYGLIVFTFTDLLGREETAHVTLPMWEKFVKAHAVELMHEVGNTFDHEFIHHLDNGRWKGDKDSFLKGNKNTGDAAQNAKAYSNDPAERNAYFQQATGTLLKPFFDGKIRTKSQFYMEIAPDPVAFYKRLLRFLPAHVQANMTPETIARFRKRAAVTWQHVMEKLK